MDIPIDQIANLEAQIHFWKMLSLFLGCMCLVLWVWVILDTERGDDE